MVTVQLKRKSLFLQTVSKVTVTAFICSKDTYLLLEKTEILRIFRSDAGLSGCCMPK